MGPVWAPKFVVCCLLLVVCCLLFVVRFLLFVVCCLLFVACWWWVGSLVGWFFVVCCLLFLVCCLLCAVFGEGLVLHFGFRVSVRVLGFP